MYIQKKEIKKKWYESQHIILSFCNFLEKEELKHIYSDMNRTDKPIHITKCEELVNAMDYIIYAIEHEKY